MAFGSCKSIIAYARELDKPQSGLSTIVGDNECGDFFPQISNGSKRPMCYYTDDFLTHFFLHLVLGVWMVWKEGIVVFKAFLSSIQHKSLTPSFTSHPLGLWPSHLKWLTLDISRFLEMDSNVKSTQKIVAYERAMSCIHFMVFMLDEWEVCSYAIIPWLWGNSRVFNIWKVINITWIHTNIYYDVWFDPLYLLTFHSIFKIIY